MVDIMEMMVNVFSQLYQPVLDSKDYLVIVLKPCVLIMLLHFQLLVKVINVHKQDKLSMLNIHIIVDK